MNYSLQDQKAQMVEKTNPLVKRIGVWKPLIYYKSQTEIANKLIIP